MPRGSSPSLAVLDRVRERRGGRSTRVRDAVLRATRERLLEDGYSGVSHRDIARRAGVDPSTVYRRWPTRARLATDALLDLADALVPVPDTGSLRSDCTAFIEAITRVLRDPQLVRLFHALAAAATAPDSEVRETIRCFWDARFDAASAMVTRGLERGELPPATAPHDMIERLVAPAYFRGLVTREPLDPPFVARCVEAALTAAGARIL